MADSADRITLAGLRATGFHGVFDHEKRDGQEFVVDIVLGTDHRAAGRSDALADTINYATVADLAMARITGPAYDLIEALAEAIAGDCLTLAGVHTVEVTVHKPAAPIPHTFADVSVTVARGLEHPFVVALGSNLGDREATLRAAVQQLGFEPEIRIGRVSGLVETDPVGGPEQSDYLNAVATGTTSLTAPDLLATLPRLAARPGRTRTVRWGERTLDLDLIQFGTPGAPDEVRSSDPALLVPHPRAAERAFVVLPWLDADPRGRIRVGEDVIPLALLAAQLDPSGVRPLGGGSDD
ncbi:2-amino-4-hydroxy-6-hydroxymethyldihydropteridin epyrophosphokinase [Nostocoides australiense Ben110]|uniref:Bifunctional folate synthesis protein n=1 Tax=Nostocoides australiense Ben110 TaxID=1193182 RepID=W6JX63_9MICO|nr:2-amino-4-hydroxy-6-hydroxymethyldihydropteridine diphosphokinase [Tetrasphaera australiensis]CCH73225.1 2-amino-4-hydroxy-6-hydroxymethyldihydropteridin epyrophosphokinase [Tetrasphaera australiensis Ben110]